MANWDICLGMYHFFTVAMFLTFHQVTRNRMVLLFWETYMMMSMNLFGLEVQSGFFHIQFHVCQKKYWYILYRQKCFTGKYTTRKIHKSYIRDPSGLFSTPCNLASECIDDVISEYFPVKHSCLCDKKNITRRLQDINFIISCQESKSAGFCSWPNM